MQSTPVAAEPQPTIDESALQQLLGRVINDVGGTSLATLVLIGDELGLYRGLASGGPQTPSELARRTQTRERYIREWLNAHAASGYVDYLPATGKYRLTTEQALVFANEDSPAFAVG